MPCSTNGEPASREHRTKARRRHRIANERRIPDELTKDVQCPGEAACVPTRRWQGSRQAPSAHLSQSRAVTIVSTRNMPRQVLKRRT